MEQAGISQTLLSAVNVAFSALWRRRRLAEFSVSAMANVLGFLLMAFALHRYFDYGILVLLVAGLACASVLAYQRLRGSPAVAAVALMVLATGLHRARWDENLLYLDFATFNSTRTTPW